MRVVGVRLEGVSRRYGRHLALRHVSASFAAGQVTLLAGPNGAGKSTLMSLLATLAPPSRGRIWFETDGGTEISSRELAAKHRRQIGLVSHASLLYEDLTALENLRLFAGLYAVENAHERVVELLERVGLTDDAERQVGNFSRGMRQRLSIARALVQDPSMVLLDEPYTGLDRRGASSLHGLVTQLRDEGRLVVLITHDLELPTGLVDRAVVLAGGRVVSEGVVEEGAAAFYEAAMEAVYGRVD